MFKESFRMYKTALVINNPYSMFLMAIKRNQFVSTDPSSICIVQVALEKLVGYVLFSYT